MKKYIKPVAIGLLLTGLFLTTGAIGVSGFGEKSAEAAGNTEAAAVQSALSLLLLNGSSVTETTLNYPIVDTGVSTYYSNNSLLTSAPATGEAFYGQDAHYNGNQPSYTDNEDDTVTDNVTGLMWQKDMGSKMTWSEANALASATSLGGYTDWRLPTIKELYSLILFTGAKGDGSDPDTYTLFIDTDYFTQPFGDTVNTEERIIDAQTWSATEYVGTTMGGDATVFGVNFIDGRIKGYPKYDPPLNTSSEGTAYFRFVRGNTDYGTNNFVDNGNGTISDQATGLMWQQADDGIARDWEDALAYAEGLELAGYDDWRLPNAKELQGIVDYTRSPDVTGSAAIDPLFSTTEIEDPDGKLQYPYFWTGTTHIDSYDDPSDDKPPVYDKAVYIAFGEAQGKMKVEDNVFVLYDVHGAGAQRSDPKFGDSASFPDYLGPQGDVRYMLNYVRCVRDI